MTTDWLSAGAMLLAGVIIGVVFLYAMKTRRKEDGRDTELLDLQAKRDALVVQLRALDDDSDERARLERETANVLRRLDERKAKTKKKDERPETVVARYAAIKGFAWGVGSVLVLVGILWYVTQKATPKTEEGMAQNAPMQQQQGAGQPQKSDPEVQGIEAAVAARPDDLVLRNQLARAYLDRENMMGVFEQTQYVLQRSPNDPQALTYQSLVRMAMGQPDNAVKMLEQAIKSDPKFLDAYVALAWSQTSSGKTDEAAATIKEAQKQHPEQAQRLTEVFAKMRETAKNQPPVQASELPPNHPPIEPPAGGAPAASSDPNAVHVTLALAAGASAPQQGIIYVIARAAGVTAGPPAAVKRMPMSAFPLTFDVSSADSMMGQPLPPKIHLEARIDSDGDAMTKDPKDPIATADNVATGSSATLTFH